MKEFSKYAGLDVHKETIAVSMAEAGGRSTTAASQEIALSQSATSSAVNELERLLSLRLFDRAGKRLLLNDNGRARWRCLTVPRMSNRWRGKAAPRSSLCG